MYLIDFLVKRNLKTCVSELSYAIASPNLDKFFLLYNSGRHKIDETHSDKAAPLREVTSLMVALASDNQAAFDLLLLEDPNKKIYPKSYKRFIYHQASYDLYNITALHLAATKQLDESWKTHPLEKLFEKMVEARQAELHQGKKRNSKVNVTEPFYNPSLKTGHNLYHLAAKSGDVANIATVFAYCGFSGLEVEAKCDTQDLALPKATPAQMARAGAHAHALAALNTLIGLSTFKNFFADYELAQTQQLLDDEGLTIFRLFEALSEAKGVVDKGEIAKFLLKKYLEKMPSVSFKVPERWLSLCSGQWDEVLEGLLFEKLLSCQPELVAKYLNRIALDEPFLQRWQNQYAENRDFVKLMVTRMGQKAVAGSVVTLHAYLQHYQPESMNDEIRLNNLRLFYASALDQGQLQQEAVPEFLMPSPAPEPALLSARLASIVGQFNVINQLEIADTQFNAVTLLYERLNA